MRFTILPVAAIAFAVLVCLSLFSGFLFGRHEYLLFGTLSKIEASVFGSRFTPKLPRKDNGFDIETTFLRLRGNSVSLPRVRPGSGGGLTSFGDDVVLVTHDGRIFAASGVSDVRLTGIAPPDNGFEAYRNISQSAAYKHQWHNLAIFRYNDIKHYEGESGSGFLLSYTEFDSNAVCYGTAVAKLELAPGVESIKSVRASADDWEVVFRSSPCLPLKDEWRAIEGHMAGGRLAIGEMNKVILGSGDYSWDGVYAPTALAQDPSNDYGKVIEIDLLTGESERISVGHRNLQGITFDRNGQLWAVEHGMRGGDELNRIERGANYGWPEETFGTMYSRLPMPNTRSYGRHEYFDAPVFAWLPSIAISSLIEINGFHDSWDGDLLLATLKDESLYRIRVRDDRLVFAERIEIGESIRYAHQHIDGRLVLWTNSRSLIFLEPTKDGFVARFIDEYLSDQQLADATSSKAKSALLACMECHSFDNSSGAGAPGLGRIYGSKIASTRFGEYSQALKEMSGIWDTESIVRFVDDPNAFADGTSMPDPGIDDPLVLEAVANVLEAFSRAAE